jgi:hypothetical protein
VTVGTVPGMSYPGDLTDDQWALPGPVFDAPGKRGRKHADDLRTVVDAMLGFTFHDRGGPDGRTKGAKRVVAVDVTGLPVAALVVPAGVLSRSQLDHPRSRPRGMPPEGALSARAVRHGQQRVAHPAKSVDSVIARPGSPKMLV